MDIFDTAKILIVRIEKLEPESVHKIVGFLLMEELKDDLIRLALSPDKVLEEKVQEAKVCIAAGCPSITSPPPYSSPATIMARNPYWNHQQVVYSDYASLGYPDSAAEDYNRLLNSNPTGQFLSIEDQLEAAAAAAGGRMAGFSGELYYPDPLVGGRISSRQTTTTTSMPSFSVKTCHYFNKGFCKHGSNCRYIHGGTSNSTHSVPDRMFGPTLIDAAGEDPAFSSGSLEKLEAEITELLKSRRGNPVSIASLPMMYHDKYGRSLQAEGYLTESQRHGRAGYSLTKLLARLKSIRLFERPHGQHFVILAEDAAKYSLDNHNEKKDPGPVVAGSRQIYLTFPAESTFTEEDVSSYFSSFGPVEDVRIPCQPKRMFGFVTFLCPNTVKMVLGKGNPHYVCGARVLVKPYREKSKLVERKYMEKAVQHMYQYYQGNYWDLDHEIHPSSTVARGCEAPRFLRRHIMELQERALDLETRHLSELKLVPTSVPTTPPYINNAIEELISSEEDTKLSAAEAKRFNHWLYVFNNGPTSSDPSRPAGGSFLHQESNNQAINLPDSSFAPRTSSSISTVI